MIAMTVSDQYKVCIMGRIGKYPRVYIYDGVFGPYLYTRMADPLNVNGLSGFCPVVREDCQIFEIDDSITERPCADIDRRFILKPVHSKHGKITEVYYAITIEVGYRQYRR